MISLWSKSVCVTFLLAAWLTVGSALGGEAATQLLSNPSFENGLRDWHPYAFNYRGGIILTTYNCENGESCLGTWGAYGRYYGFGSAQPYLPGLFGGGAYQLIDHPPETLDLTYSFWVYPWNAGLGALNTRSFIILKLADQTGQEKIFLMNYHIAWKGQTEVTANRLPHIGDYFVHAKNHAWNHAERNIRQDFEAAFGDSSSYRIISLEIHLELAIFNANVGTQFAFWDDLYLSKAVERSGPVSSPDLSLQPQDPSEALPRHVTASSEISNNHFVGSNGLAGFARALAVASQGANFLAGTSLILGSNHIF